jgi:hypothetical protein
VDGCNVAKDRLINHSGLPVGKKDKDLLNESLYYDFYVADRDQTLPNLDLLDDVISCLGVLNLCFNGPDPDTRAPGPRAQPIPDIVPYSVACILSSSLGYYQKWSTNHYFPDDVLAALLTGIDKIAFSWMQLLAGDITDLLEGFGYA